MGLSDEDEDEYQPGTGEDGEEEVGEEGEEEDAGVSDEETDSEPEREQESRRALWARTTLYVLFSSRLMYPILL